ASSVIGPIYGFVYALGIFISHPSGIPVGSQENPLFHFRLIGGDNIGELQNFSIVGCGSKFLSLDFHPKALHFFHKPLSGGFMCWGSRDTGSEVYLLFNIGIGRIRIKGGYWIKFLYCLLSLYFFCWTSAGHYQDKHQEYHIFSILHMPSQFYPSYPLPGFPFLSEKP